MSGLHSGTQKYNPRCSLFIDKLTIRHVHWRQPHHALAAPQLSCASFTVHMFFLCLMNIFLKHFNIVCVLYKITRKKLQPIYDWWQKQKRKWVYFSKVWNLHPQNLDTVHSDRWVSIPPKNLSGAPLQSVCVPIMIIAHTLLFSPRKSIPNLSSLLLCKAVRMWMNGSLKPIILQLFGTIMCLNYTVLLCNWTADSTLLNNSVCCNKISSEWHASYRKH